MKHKYILSHAINLREGYFILSRSQERSQVKKIIRGLEWPSQTIKTSVGGEEGLYRVRREHGGDFVIDQCP
jgi:hypothetical protein